MNICNYTAEKSAQYIPFWVYICTFWGEGVHI